jgi:CO/xanthine dehydrogenase FAD-binding subunit
MGYLVAASLSEVLDALGKPDAAVIAGGTDWFPAQGTKPFKGDLVDISRVPGLRGITRETSGWRIGGATTWTDLIRADLPPAFDGLKAAAREVGSIQIQNAGTVAGNLCNASPAADGVPPLLTLGALVELVSARGIRRMALSEFLIGPRKTALMPGEVLAALIIPDLPGSAQGASSSWARGIILSSRLRWSRPLSRWIGTGSRRRRWPSAPVRPPRSACPRSRPI